MADRLATHDEAENAQKRERTTRLSHDVLCPYTALATAQQAIAEPMVVKYP